jgi:hypothetical protein
MLFGRGQWAIMGIEPKFQEAFQQIIRDPKQLFYLSQLVAGVRTRYEKKLSLGINPFAHPRMDETLPEDSLERESIHDFLELEPSLQADAEIQPEDYAVHYGSTENLYLLNENPAGNVYGFWVVLNDFDDVTDVASKKEQVSYDQLTCPFRFAKKEEKQMVEATVLATTVPVRKQFPVIVDFQSGRIFIASSNVEEIGLVTSLLEDMGAVVLSLMWDFGPPTWPRDFLNKVCKETRYAAEFIKRMEERCRFEDKEVEKLADKMLEDIVSNYFAMTELETAQWAGLTTPARLKLYKHGDAVAVSEPTIMTALLGMAPDTYEITAAAVTFQELTSRFNRKGEELFVRTDLFTLDINDNINLVDAGAAMLRGFDLPQYKKEIKQLLKARSGEFSIQDYWYQWLLGMRAAVESFSSNVADTLYVNGAATGKYGLKQYGFETETTEVTVDPGQGQKTNE